MREAVIVSTARTGLAKSHRGGFNNTGGVAMAGHAIAHSIERAGIDPAEVEEVVLGCGTPQGTTGNNVGRLAALKAGCPIETTGVTVSRHCSSGLNAIATAAGRIIVDRLGLGVLDFDLIERSEGTEDGMDQVPSPVICPPG